MVAGPHTHRAIIPAAGIPSTPGVFLAKSKIDWPVLQAK